MYQWYLLRTKTNSEFSSQSKLLAAGFTSYVPRVLRRIRRAGRRYKFIAPLFPHYLFCQLALGEQDLEPVKRVRSVVGIVRFGDECAVVPERVIETLRAREDTVTGMIRLMLDPPMRSNTPVRITGGPFEHMEGLFLRECGEDRVLVLLEILGQNRPVELGEQFVERKAVVAPLLAAA